MTATARKTLLPHFTLTEVADENDADAVRVIGALDAYSIKPVLVEAEGQSQDGKACFIKRQWNRFPLARDEQGVPWAEAMLYILFRLQDQSEPEMATYANIADDLAVYRRYLDESDVDWTQFPVQKLRRPTYRFNGHLTKAVMAGATHPTTAKRRMSTVIAFYRWLVSESVLMPANEPWKEADQYVPIKDTYGFPRTKKVATTDISIRVPQQDDPYDGTIDDDGKLRPLSHTEQEWLIDALTSLRNTEMTLIHLFGLLTGARIQTVLTFKVRHFLLDLADITVGDLRLPVGPGTGIDTKRNKKMVLHIPVWFYRRVQTYLLSERAKKRRIRAIGGDTKDQYLFLSQRGAPLYQSKSDAQRFDVTNVRRYKIDGGGVREFIANRVVPFIQRKYKAREFNYSFHDTRATAGMNWTDHQLKLVTQGKTTLHEAREFVKTRMGHTSAVVTDRYLQFRRNLKLVRWAEEGHEIHLQQLARRAMEGVL